MSDTPYKITKEADLMFSFQSVGKNGIIEKIVRYDRINEEYFNLGFGDKIKDTLLFDDKKVTNNQDIRLIISTVISTIPIFFGIEPTAVLIFKGSNDVRTKLYHRIIKNNFSFFKGSYWIFGSRNEENEAFNPNKEYDHYLVIKK